MNFMQMLRKKWSEGKAICVGLDIDPLKVPDCIRLASPAATILDFNRKIVEATRDLVCAYKPNAAFYEAYGEGGMSALKTTIQRIHDLAPDVPVILDAKRGDIGNTNEGYLKMAFEVLKADAITVHPYLGADALEPFLARADKGIIVLCRTSNPGAGEFQDLFVNIDEEEAAVLDEECCASCGPKARFYEYVAYQVSCRWNRNGNCAVVVGATAPYQLADVRKIVGDMPILIPGLGAQGGDLEKTVTAGKDSRNQGMIINLSRSVLYASKEADFAEAARQEVQRVQTEITQILKGGMS
ncbi:MAG: orotidine 5'-phosphate decarboxylase [Candidatus Staskawiczbacteria bacterium RIFCSPHIGHO2_02_FULL_43_16]|uniref:Orotidine 5'-phosphate decarboxylase n=1 Tax=Candidatus Staskawiczbacteria bacterium RIFCSPHIGHO2_01_FULL_41_41 TaxID=1802203 RepID=A0A1G2HSD3_9BACT|nr:MAG: orotidine 5'-phosphate decarboxylase [Candidatus Staskawiczbacteria bacterium RIFCSPHIGHO2_01_FULL_41_41]OGZ67978.1 MAG: orotidine 5'-phosphate decarboxylase [Candidatus Staskawiczbacteria bacterium RIFCSPHIGHO2_02_FULL_43_16]OGZ74543.1 MAG: orotidine 5'-phosphate decarboxylase [Candidatus Staskawiczbacteria bacterium RIFCSPLOWO2_01_FULL_43_17b]